MNSDDNDQVIQAPSVQGPFSDSAVVQKRSKPEPIDYVAMVTAMGRMHSGGGLRYDPNK
jgi:hypothetical protein